MKKEYKENNSWFETCMYKILKKINIYTDFIFHMCYLMLFNAIIVENYIK